MQVDFSEYSQLADLQERQISIIRSVDRDQQNRMTHMMDLLERVMELKVASDNSKKPREEVIVDSDPLNLAESDPELVLET